MDPIVVCKDCGKQVPRRGPVQFYCCECSEKRDLLRKRLWAREHPFSPAQHAQRKLATNARKEMSRQAGEIANATQAKSILWFFEDPPEWDRKVAFSIPFSYAASKNHIYALRKAGHVALRRESRLIRERIAHRVQELTKTTSFYQNKIWLDILVQKPNHRGDAVNVVDLVCDGVKRGLGIDDRWFCIRRLDWQVVKTDPLLYIGISQEAGEGCMVCSYCGEIKPFSEFNKAKHNPMGVGRECKDCRRVGRKMSKQRRTDLVQDGSHTHADCCENSSSEE